MKKRLSNILVIIFLFIIAFLICMKSPTDILSKGGSSYTDSSVFKYIGLSMTKGYVPYLDLFDHKGLLLYFINYIGVIISPTIGVWIIEFIFMFVSVLFTYKLARKFTSKPISLLITGIAFSQIYNYFEGGNLTEEYALPFQIISLYIFFDFFLNPEKYSNKTQKGKSNLFNIPVFICGICFACVLFLRVNMISIWIVFGIMVLIYCIANKKYLELLKFVLSFLLGILVVTIPMLIYLLKNGALESFINDYILFNIKYSSNAVEMDKIDTFVAFFNTEVTRFAFIIMAIKVYMQIKNKEKCYFNVGYLAYMLVTLLLISMSGYNFAHYGMTMLPALIYPYCVMYQFLEKEKIKNIGINLMITAYLLYLIIIPVWTQFSVDYLREIYDETTTTNSNELIDYIIENTKEDELISVFGNNNSFYYLTNRQSASKYSYQTPIAEYDKEIVNEYFNDLKENKPKLIIWNIDVSRYSEMVDTMIKFLDENNYKLVKDGNIRIYEINGEI